MKSSLIGMCILVAGTAVGCQSAATHQESLSNAETEKFTLGTVTRKIQVGMSQAEVARALGSPNIVTKDAHGKEAWIYDKAAREVSYSKDQGGVWLILGGYSKEAGASRSSQKTITVVIKFDGIGHVEDVTYHSSQF